MNDENTRKIDSMGRIVLPKAMRNELGGLKKRHKKMRALDMRKEGVSIKDIASEMEMTESCVWSLITEGENECS